MPKLPSFPDFVKYPLHAVLYVLLAYFIYKEFTKTDQCADLRRTVAAQDKRITKLEGDKDDLTMALLVKNGIINEIKKSTDSAARKSFGDAAKRIIEK